MEDKVTEMKNQKDQLKLKNEKLSKAGNQMLNGVGGAPSTEESV